MATEAQRQLLSWTRSMVQEVVGSQTSQQTNTRSERGRVSDKSLKRKRCRVISPFSSANSSSSSEFEGFAPSSSSSLVKQSRDKVKLHKQVNYDISTAKNLLLLANSTEEQQKWVSRLGKRIPKKPPTPDPFARSSPRTSMKVQPNQSMRRPSKQLPPNKPRLLDLACKDWDWSLADVDFDDIDVFDDGESDDDDDDVFVLKS